MPVVFANRAHADLRSIYLYTAERAPIAAHRFVNATVDHCMKLDLYPERGTKRSDLRPRLRTIGFRRRVTIAFRVDGGVVTILRVFYGGQNYEAALRDEDE
jgi:toxin ParE1/3/4